MHSFLYAMKRKDISISRITLSILFVISLVVAGNLWAKEAPKVLEVEARAYPGKDPNMWDGVYAAKSGKVYSGIMTEGSSAHFYVYDPQTDKNTLLYDMAEFEGSRGKGIRTSGKIHNKPVEDQAGNIYFVPMTDGAGPRSIDYTSYVGGHWMQYDPSTGALHSLGLVDEHVGCYPLAIDTQRDYLFGVGFNEYLYRFDIKQKKTTKVARVASWDIDRNIFADDEGNVYGAFGLARIWKYDAKKERVEDLNLHIPYDPTIYPTELENPMIDRSTIWRAVQWDPLQKVAYGVTCGSGSILFRFDPHQGSQGEITQLTRIPDPKYWNTNRKDIPYSPLAFTVDSKRQKIYFVPSARQYSLGTYAETFASHATHHLVMYDIAAGQRVDLGAMQTADGRRVFGCEGATVGPDGTVYLVGQVEVKQRSQATRIMDGKIPVALQLVIVHP